ncbi:hypothetical protein AAFN46_17515 [Pseudomonas sp. CAU 1711]
MRISWSPGWAGPGPGEVVADDIAAAAAGVVCCDEIEPLSDGMQAFWVSSPAVIIYLVC